MTATEERTVTVATVSVTIDGNQVSVAEGTTIFDAAREVGVDIPVLCHNERYDPVGVCRMCVVDTGGRVFAAACVRPCEDGMEVKTATPELDRSRATLTELLVADQPPRAEDPKDTTTRDNLLLSLADGFGVARETTELPCGSGRGTDSSNPVIDVNHDACILCDRCVRACDDIQGNDVIGRSGKGYATRIAFDLNDPMGASSCVTCGECVQACPTGALTNKPIRDIPIRPREELDAVDSVCPYCGVGCALTYYVDRERGAISFAEGRDQPGSQSRLCVKGRYGWDYAASPQRLTTPLIRIDSAYPKGPLSADVRGDSHNDRGRVNGGERSGGGRKPGDKRGGKRKPGGLVNYDEVMPHFREATWEEALDLVARRLGEIHAEGGPGAIAGFGSAKCSNEEAYLFQKLIRTGFRTNNVDHCTRLCHASSVAALFEGVGSGAVSTTYGDVANADCVIITGSNPTANHPVASSFFKQARRRGTKIIYVDPRASTVAEHADIFVQLKPGTDVAFYNSVMHEIIRLGLVDREFIANRTSNYDELARTVADYPPERAAQITGVDADTHPRGRPHLGRGGRRGRLLGDGDLPAHHRHRQRPLPHRAVLDHRQRGTAGHRAAPAARAEQRAGRLGRRADPDVLPRLPGRRRGEDRGCGSRRPGAPALDPKRGLTVTEIIKLGAATRRRARHVHARREPVPVRPEHQQGAQGAGRARVPRCPGHLPHRDRRVRRRDPARHLLPGEGRHVHQHRPAGAARPQGDGPAGAGPPGLGDRPGRRPPSRAGLELRLAERGLRRDGRADAVLPEPAATTTWDCPGSSTRTTIRSTPTARSSCSTSGSTPTTGSPTWCPRSGCRPRSCPTRSTRWCSTPGGCWSTGTPAR